MTWMSCSSCFYYPRNGNNYYETAVFSWSLSKTGMREICMEKDDFLYEIKSSDINFNFINYHNWFRNMFFNCWCRISYCYNSLIYLYAYTSLYYVSSIFYCTGRTTVGFGIFLLYSRAFWRMLSFLSSFFSGFGTLGLSLLICLTWDENS